MLITPKTSLLVLSTIDQYINYAVKPPVELLELREIYKVFIGAHVAESQRKREGKILNLVSLWSRRLGAEFRLDLN